MNEVRDPSHHLFPLNSCVNVDINSLFKAATLNILCVNNGSKQHWHLIRATGTDTPTENQSSNLQVTSGALWLLLWAHGFGFMVPSSGCWVSLSLGVMPAAVGKKLTKDNISQILGAVTQQLSKRSIYLLKRQVTSRVSEGQNRHWEGILD